MDFSFSTLLAGLVFGAFGIYLIKEGKRRENVSSILIGVSLFVFPYVLTQPVWLVWAVGAGLGWLAYRLW